MKIRLLLLTLALLSLTLPAAWGQEGLFAQGKEVYKNNCADCHRSNGKGLPVTFPAHDGNPLCSVPRSR